MMPRFGFQLNRDLRRVAQDYFGLNDLDRRIKKHLDIEGGFFIEAGANNGIAQSNTLHFERHCGWKGLLVEPVPELAWRCRAVRRHALTVNVALGGFAQRGTRLNMTYCNLMSVVDGALGSAEAGGAHVALGAQIQNVQPYRLNVPCAPLSDLLDRYGIGRIDLLSLDLEGNEAAALCGIDFERHRPRFLLVEARHRGAVDDAVRAHYVAVEELTEYDVLYRARSDLPVTYAVGWAYRIERGLGNTAALGRIFVK